MFWGNKNRIPIPARREMGAAGEGGGDSRGLDGGGRVGAAGEHMHTDMHMDLADGRASGGGTRLDSGRTDGRNRQLCVHW